MRPHRGTLILVLGVLSILGFVPLAPAAWWMGMHDILQMADGKMDPSGKRATDIGRFLGMVVTVLTCLMLAILLVMQLLVAG